MRHYHHQKLSAPLRKGLQRAGVRLLCGSLLVLFACSSANPARETAKANAPDASIAPVHLTVSFFSIGTGPDTEMKTAYDRLVGQFRQVHQVVLLVEKVSWGREGEVDYCFDLSDLEISLRQKFYAESSERLQSSSLVRITADTPCREARE